MSRHEILDIPNAKVRVWPNSRGTWTGFIVRGCGPILTRDTREELVRALAQHREEIAA
jgi:hypothetical protein